MAIGSRPTSGGFLSPDHSKGGLQTRCVVTTKRIRPRCRSPTLSRGASWEERLPLSRTASDKPSPNSVTGPLRDDSSIRDSPRLVGRRPGLFLPTGHKENGLKPRKIASSTATEVAWLPRAQARRSVRARGGSTNHPWLLFLPRRRRRDNAPPRPAPDPSPAPLGPGRVPASRSFPPDPPARGRHGRIGTGPRSTRRSPVGDIIPAAGGGLQRRLGGRTTGTRDATGAAGWD